MLSWYFATTNPLKHPPPFRDVIIFAPLAGVFFAYAMPWMISFCPSYVRIFDEYLMQIRGNSCRRIKYEDVSSFCWSQQREFTTLVLISKTGGELIFGMPSDLPVSGLDEFLRDRGIPFKSAGQDSSAAT
jgi:hypothetical protein